MTFGSRPREEAILGSGNAIANGIVQASRSQALSAQTQGVERVIDKEISSWKDGWISVRTENSVETLRRSEVRRISRNSNDEVILVLAGGERLSTVETYERILQLVTVEPRFNVVRDMRSGAVAHVERILPERW